MQIRFYKTLWGFDGNYPAAVERALADGYDGIEGPAPQDPKQRRRFAAALEANGLDYIQEICTGGDYVPERHADPDRHLADLQHAFERGADLEPRFVTTMAGCDAWPEAQSIDFFGRALDLAERYGVILCIETHRSRSTFNPWTTLRIVQALPGIRLTADFSHWCVVCERLIDTEMDVIQALAPVIHHIHARVGYDQGPQVPHPAAPEYAQALAAHQRWWRLIWERQREKGYAVTTMTSEFGPDGYLHHSPFSNRPVADLDQINRWMMQTQRQQFAAAFPQG